MSQIIDDLPGSPTVVGIDNPFPGLRPFKVEESHLFFGREGQSDEVLLKLSKSRFVGVIGPSGSGKSSFIYCGVLPILYGGFLTDSSPNWEVVVTRPGAGPIDNLAESLLKTSKDYTYADPEDKKIKRTIVSTLLRSSSLGLVEAIQQSRRSADINYLVLVDQFEELFRFKDSTDPNSVNETLAFVNLLMEAVNYEDSPIYVAITMRSDFIGDCAQFPELTRKINDSHYLIPQMTRDQKRRAIEGPVAVGNAKIAPRLTQQLLNDLGDNPDQLPILQHALMRTWSYWSKYRDYEDEVLDLKHYEAIGTMKEALSMHANEAYDELEDDQKRICEVMFKAITEKRGESFGIRRPTRLNEIASIADVSENEVIEVIEKFREPGRSLLTPGHGLPLGSKSMIDISHESLMRIWVRLKNWVDDEADAVQMYLRLAEAANMYQVGKAGLWRPPDLQLALNWQVKHKPTLVWGQRYHPAFERTMIFLEYSKKEFETEQRIKELEAKRKLQRARTTALVFGIITIFALIALVYAFVQKGIADEKQQEALVNAQKAIEQSKIAEAERKKAEVAAEEAKRQQGIAEQNAIEAKRQQKIAEDAKKLADENAHKAELSAAEAKRQQKIAEEQKKIADANADAAIKAQKAAERERYLAVAKSIALKSKELTDFEQAALLAQQAYNFNTRFNGYAYDNDIYNGLFSALRNYQNPLTQSLEGHNKGAARALVTRENNSSIFSGGSDGRVLRWSQQQNGLWTHEVMKEFSTTDGTITSTTYAIYSLDISPDGNYLAVGGLFNADRDNNYAMLINLNNPGAEPTKIMGYKSDIEHINFTLDGKGFYARCNSGKSIMYSDLKTAREVITPLEKITSIDLSPDGTKLAGAGTDGNLYLWDLKNNYAQTKYSVLRQGKDILAIQFMPDSRGVVIGDEEGIVRIFVNGVIVRTLTGHTSQIEQIKFSHSGKFMATASKDGSVRLWNINQLTEEPQVLADHDWVWSVAFTPDDEQLMAGIHAREETVKGVNQTIHAWPTKIKTMSTQLCGYVKQNMSQQDWNLFMKGLKYEATCTNLPPNNK
ncbi:MAG: High-affnity carbon uptake protein Hat/HatR [Bacteroidetes bacterium]|nr:High-affnity carbon uptake protein Hat/HatR [Bacteroidota bacterium]